MRVVWCLLILLSVLAPAGQFGITQTPADAAQLTAPGARTIASSSELDVDRNLGIQIAVSALEIGSPQRALVAVTQQHVSVVGQGRHVSSSASSRGPPV